jgi:hypothetical protein
MPDSKKIDDGGPAFPREAVPPYSEATATGFTQYMGETGHPGMSLRDWFAGQAVSVLLGRQLAPDVAIERACENAAHWSYRLADAMLAARKAEPVDDMDQVRADRQDWLQP